jgi:hypothetical protein
MSVFLQREEGREWGWGRKGGEEKGLSSLKVSIS